MRRVVCFPSLATALVLGLLISTISCVEETQDRVGAHERVQELRPTNGQHPRGYEEGVEVRSLASPGGYARVWWATEGVDRPPSSDLSASGVPDFVELVADVADETQKFLIEDGLFRLPIVDSTLISDPEAYGGDDRFDIYLKDFGGAGDGHFSVDACEVVEAVSRCAGHMVLENDFAPLYYPSLEYAVRVVVPHEYFHAVQFAYSAEMPPWWSEGTATWFEEYFYPEQDDFERLTRHYFHEPERSLTDRPRGPSDGFAYGASIFVYFLEHYVGVEAIVEAMETMALGVRALDAVVEAVEKKVGDFEEAFSNFGVFNLFTGTRTIEGRGYPEAWRFEEVDVVELDAGGALNWDVQVRPMAARFGRIDVKAPIELSIRSIEGFDPVRAIAVSPGEFAESGEVHVLGKDEVRVFEPGDSPVFLVVTQGVGDDDGAVRIALRMSRDEGLAENGDEADDDDDDDEISEPPPEVEIELDESTGCAQYSHSGPSPLSKLSPLLVMVFFAFRKT